MQTKNGKPLVIGFSLFATFAIVFACMRIWQNINLDIPVSDSPAFATESNPALEQLKQQTLDTDNDGLSDYDETYRHGTSPYLADTDSDGISDNDEFVNGTDPNCVEGSQCGSLIINTDEPPPQTDTQDASLQQDAEISGETQSALDSLSAGKNLTPAEIRALLKNAGISDEQLSGASDQDLLNLFNEVSNEPQAN